VSWCDRIFEVVAADPMAGGAICYRLVPWPEAHAIRTLQQYDEAAEAARDAARAEESRGLRHRGFSILLAPLAGLLPGHVQRQMEREFGAPARAMTISSSLLLFALGIVTLVFGFSAAVGGAIGQSGRPGGPTLPLLLGIFCLSESSVRLASAWLLERPMGLLAVEIPYALFRRDRRRLAPLEPPPGTLRKDRYRMLEALLALLPPSEQARLTREFGFDALLWGRRTALLLGIVAGLNAAVAVLNAVYGAGSAADGIWFLAGGLLAVEQAMRLARLRAGKPAGSVLGAFVRPLARPLLEAAPRPPASPS
jgi:hypothetical protein